MRCLFGFLCVCTLSVVPFLGCSDTQPECETGADCNDDNECTNDVCESASKTCSNTSVEDDTLCDFDGFPGLCKAGVCEDAKLCEGVECDDDGDECTEDVCNPADGTCGVPVENGTACSSGACLDGVCTALVTVSGTVDGGESPGVTTVSVDGTSLSTTTDGLGQFLFGVFPGDWFFQTSKDNKAWSGIQVETVPTTGRSDLKLEVGLDEDIPVVEEECMIEIDEAKGLVSLSFDPVSGEGGETATLSVPHDGAVTDDAEGNCVVTETLPAGQRDLSFFNVDLTEELIVTPVGPDGYRCSLERPGTVYPVRASFHTRQVGVRCTPL